MSDVKYSGCGRYVVETTHGYYHDEQWGYAATSDNLEDAKKKVITFGTDYRVIENKTGNVVYTHPGL